MAGHTPPAPGELCVNVRGEQHPLLGPRSDTELQSVFGWLAQKPLARLFGGAIESAIDYVLDGPRTGRFDLNDSAVDSDERRTVGTKLQYHLLDALELPKLRSPDTLIANVPVDIKGTVGENWSIPREAQCELCICVRVDTKRGRHRSWLMRTHRAWLHGGRGNGDQKRGIMVEALRLYGVPLYDWTGLPVNPLTLLGDEGRAAVFAPGVGQERRFVELFQRLPDTIIPRSAILTVGFDRQDPIRRVRAVRVRLTMLGLELLCGTWEDEYKRALTRGFDLTGDAWVALGARSEPDGASNESPSPLAQLFEMGAPIAGGERRASAVGNVPDAGDRARAGAASGRRTPATGVRTYVPAHRFGRTAIELAREDGLD